MALPIIIRGADFSDIIQIVTQPNGTPLKIKNSTAANPSVIETDLPHELVNNDKVYIWGHKKNTIVNGNHTATKVDAFKISVPVTGVIAGEEYGEVGKCINATGYTVTLAIKGHSGGSVVSGVTVTLEWVDQTIFRFKAKITNAHTALLTARSQVIIEVTYVDTDSFDRIFTQLYQVKDA